MKNVILISIMLFSCTSAERVSPCEKKEYSYRYVNQKSEAVIYTLNFESQKARVFENKDVVDDQGFGYSDLDLDISDFYFNLGGIVVPKVGEIGAVSNWQYNGVGCVLLKKTTNGYSASCKSNPYAGHLEYHFDFGRGITRIEQFLTDGNVVVENLTSAKGLGSEWNCI